MSVYIKGMETPTSCPCELLGIGYDLYCSFAGGIPARVKEYYECCQNGTRPSWCPLVYVPTHGRLIDADALVDKHFGKEYLSKVMTADKDDLGTALVNVPLVINNAPTIIPAEEREL